MITTRQFRLPFLDITSFGYLNITQFLGAMNDNIFKLLIIYFFLDMDGIENSHIILSTTGATFVLPYLLFSSSAGILADRFSKRNIIISVKTLELLIMCLGLFAFTISNQLFAYGVLFLLACHSALFSPSKYGILPELLPQEKISRANGLMTSCTYLAIILGTFLASFIVDISGRNFTIAALFCIGFSLIGLISSTCIQYTPPSGSHKTLNRHFIGDIYKTLEMVRSEPSLLPAMLGSAFFLFIAGYTQLNMIPFAVTSLHLTDVQGGYLFLLTAIGIGTGSIIAGRISGRVVELGLVPLAGIGITACFYLLNFYSDSLAACIPLVVIIGIFGGIYLIPLDSYIQITSPKQYLGQALAATTFLSFVGVLLASGLLYVASGIFGLKASHGFVMLGSITLIITGVYTFLFFDYMTRFLGMILSRLHFQTTFNGLDHVPDSPAIYLCTHTAWNDTLLMLGAQRRRMRFFIEQEQEHSKWLKRLYRLLRVVLIPEIEPLRKNSECLNAIRDMLNRGISVCIFVENANVDREFEKLKHARLVQEILQDTPYPVLVAHIDKGIKEKQPRFFTRLLNKCRIPATVSFRTVSWEITPAKWKNSSEEVRRTNQNKNIYLSNEQCKEY